MRRRSRPRPHGDPSLGFSLEPPLRRFATGPAQRGRLIRTLNRTPDPVRSPRAPRTATAPRPHREQWRDVPGGATSESMTRLAYQRDEEELAALVEHVYPITWSARSSSECGIVSPRALAVFRLMTSSNFVGCSTGRSAGLVPLRTRST